MPRGSSCGPSAPSPVLSCRPRDSAMGRVLSLRRAICVLFWAALALSAAAVGNSADAARIERVRSPGGIEAWLIEDHSVPVLSLRVIFRGGSALDPADKVGLANMTAALLDEGAGPL